MSNDKKYSVYRWLANDLILFYLALHPLVDLLEEHIPLILIVEAIPELFKSIFLIFSLICVCLTHFKGILTVFIIVKLIILNLLNEFGKNLCSILFYVCIHIAFKQLSPVEKILLWLSLRVFMVLDRIRVDMQLQAVQHVDQQQYHTHYCCTNKEIL